VLTSGPALALDLRPGSDGAADRPGRRPACGTGSPRRSAGAQRCPARLSLAPACLSVAAVPFMLAERVRLSAAVLGVNNGLLRSAAWASWSAALRVHGLRFALLAHSIPSLGWFRALRCLHCAALIFDPWPWLLVGPVPILSPLVAGAGLWSASALCERLALPAVALCPIYPQGRFAGVSAGPA
jgi:hypothetical protein